MQSINTPQKPDIAQLGHSVLRKKAQIVENILADECQDLISEMMQTVADAGGVGIAAPQVYKSLRIFINYTGQ